jgi:hypothetical protein
MVKRQSADQLKTISNTQKRLEDLNSRLRDVIVQANPEQNGDYIMPPSDRLEASEMISQHLDYIDAGLDAVRSSVQASKDLGGPGLAAIEAEIEGVNRQMWVALNSVDPLYPSPPEEGYGLDARLDWLRESIRKVEDEFVRAADASNVTAADKQKVEQVETVLMGLWDIIQSGLADIQQRKEERKRIRLEKGLQDDEDELSGDESFEPDEPYSLPAFSTKVQWLYAQATSLKEQKSVLKRLIKQQRELNNKSDTQRDIELQAKVDEHSRTKDLLERTEKEAMEALQKLADVLRDLEAAQKTNAADESAAIKAAQDQLKERNDTIAAL